MDRTRKTHLWTLLTIFLGLAVFSFAYSNLYFLYAGLLLCTIGLLSSQAGMKIHDLWMKLAWILSLIVPRIILFIIFYLILTPIAWISKIFRGKGPLKKTGHTHSQFSNQQRIVEAADFLKPW